MRIKTFPLLTTTLLLLGLILTACSPQPTATLPSEIIIGVYEPMTGFQAEGGQQTMQGINLAYEQDSSALGLPVRLVLMDNRSDRFESASVVNRLIEQEHVIAIIGSYGSSNAIAGGAVAEAAGIPVMGCSPTSPLVTTGRDYYFRVSYIDPFQARVMAQYAVDQEISRIAIIYNITQAYSVGLANDFRQSWIELTGSADGIVATVAYSDGDEDFTDQITLSMTAEAIYIPGYFGDAARLMQQARDLGYTGRFLGSDGWEAPELLSIGGEAVEGAVFTTHFSAEVPDSPLAQQFVTQFEARYGEPPSAFAALGYDAYRLVLDSIERAQSADPDAIRDAMAATRNFAGVTGSITIDDSGNAVKNAVLMVVRDGAFEFLALAKP